jgi:hypothetical protein
MIERGTEILWQKPNPKYKTELQYLESTGKQYIDSGVILTSTSDYEFVGALCNNTQTGWIAGTPTWVGIHTKLGTVAVTQTSSGHKYIPVNVNEVFKIGLFGDKAYFNDAETNTLTRKNSTATLFLFAYHHTNDTGSINSAMRLYSFKIWDNGELVRDFIPVLDLNDVACLYDKVSGELFYNQGTEDFKYAI